MTLQLEIVSPTKLLLTRDVDMVVMPGYEGDLAAQPGDAPMITLLRGGVITIYDNMVAGDRFFVPGGFAEITADRCTILADEVVPVGDLAASAAAARLAAAEKAWDEVDKLDMAARDAVLDQLQSAREEVRVAQG